MQTDCIAVNAAQSTTTITSAGKSATLRTKAINSLPKLILKFIARIAAKIANIRGSIPFPTGIITVIGTKTISATLSANSTKVSDGRRFPMAGKS